MNGRPSWSQRVPAALVLALIPLLAAVFAGSASAQVTRRHAIRYASNGTWDETFNNVNSNGGPKRLVQADPAGVGTIFHDVVVASDGKYVLAGKLNNRFLVQRLTSSGQPDSTFGTNGVVTTSFSTFAGVTAAEAMGVAVDPLGGVIAVGSVTQSGSLKVAVARYLADGTLNMLFGTGGLVITTVSAGHLSAATAVKISGSNILVGGYTHNVNVFAIRYTNTGQLDTNYGNTSPKTGISRITPVLGLSTPMANDMALDSSGRVVLGGTGTVSGQNVFAAWRLTTGGAADTGLSGDGFVAYWPGATAAGQSVATDGNKIVIAGWVNVANRKLGMLRFNSDGTMDTGFDGDGWKEHDIASSTSESVFEVAVGSGGAIAVTGNQSSGSTFLGRFSSSGANQSLVSVDVVPSSFETGVALAIDGSGRFVVAGQANP